MQNLENLFNPKSIAIVGASEEEGKVGTAITKNILELGYQGQTFLVNNKHENLFGRKCYKNISEIGSAVDLAIIAIPAQFVNQVIKEAADKVNPPTNFGEVYRSIEISEQNTFDKNKNALTGKVGGGVKNYIVISAGFSETGDEGKAREEELKNIAGQNNLNILGPNCLGFIIPGLKLNASFAGGMPAEGNIALVSQSGALIAAIFDMAEKEGLKFSNVISIGNKMEIDETALIQYLENDPNTKVVALYLEGIKDGQAFIAACRKSQKPIVILKAGKTERSQRAISSHTGALAGSAEIIKAVFSKCGVMQAENLEEFINLMLLTSLSQAPSNNSVAVITNAGGPGVLITDAFKNKKIQLAEISEKAKKKLKTFLPAESSVENPIDLLGDADQSRYQKTLKILDKEENIGSIVNILTPQEQTPVGKIAGALVRFKNKTAKNMATVFIGKNRTAKPVQKIKTGGMVNFDFPDQAVDSLDKYYIWKKSKEQLDNFEFKADENRRQAATEIIQKAAEAGIKALSFADARTVMGLYQIPVIEKWDEGDAENIKYPVVAKVDSDQVLHKTDQKALILNINNPEELQKATKEIRVNFPSENIIIQPMQPIKTELILGMKRDPVFGPVILAGLGGIYTEIFKMVDFFIPPASILEIKETLDAGKLSFLFKETRGQKPYNIDNLAQIINNLCGLSLENDQIKEIDVNPLLIYNDGRESVAVDVKIII